MKNIIEVVFSSHLSPEENKTFENHISNTIGCNHNIHCYENKNQYSLCEVYNDSLKNHHKNENQIFLFLHNDILFKTRKWGKILLRKFNNHDKDIIGVAGSTQLSENGVWWMKKDKMFGRVSHTDGLREWVSDYNSKFLGLKDVVVIDGLFMAVNPDMVEYGFDETFKGFHFYDISFCLKNFINGLNIGVTNEINVLHKSIGQTNEQWEENRKLFIKKYKEYLPLNLEDYD